MRLISMAVLVAAFAAHAFLPCAIAAGPAAPSSQPAQNSPIDTLRFDAVEGVLLVQAAVRGPAGRDTSGEFVLDTGAGYLSLDAALAAILGMTTAPFESGEITFSERPASRLIIAGSQLDQVQPVLLFDGAIVRQVTDRQVLGLIGQRVLAGLALRFRFPERQIELVAVDGGRGSSAPDGGPSTLEEREHAIARSRAAIGGWLVRESQPVTFMLAGDGKILVRARIKGTSDTLNLVLDTGASKSVFFRGSLERAGVRSDRWPAARGLVAPTLLGPEPADLVRVPEIAILGDRGAISTRAMDAIVAESRLEEMLSDATGRPIDGLLGYSYLRRFDVALDYPNRVLWLTPIPHQQDERPYEHSHVGLQVERREEGLTIIAVAAGSPADQAGLRAADILLTIDGRAITGMNLAEANQALEGPPGSTVRVTVQRGEENLTRKLVRRRLL